METKHISNKLKMRFFSGNVTGKEIKEVLLAAELDPDLKEEIEIMTSISGDLEKIQANLTKELSEKAKIISFQPSYIRPMLKAAQNKNLKAAADCVVRCEHEILKSYQPAGMSFLPNKSLSSLRWDVHERIYRFSVLRCI